MRRTANEERGGELETGERRVLRKEKRTGAGEGFKVAAEFGDGLMWETGARSASRAG
jgi:hypothetical protein